MARNRNPDPASGRGRLTTAGLTMAALVAFAANSLLCRLALRETVIDPASFTTIRIVSGALTLAGIASWTGGGARAPRLRSVQAGSWTSAAWLVIYAVPFAMAYTGLGAGTGALILFGAVQVTMMVAALGAGERPRVIQWTGLGLAFGGLVILVRPGLTAPPLPAAASMAVAGVAWGVYSWKGRQSTDPLRHTAGNFVRAVPLAAVVSIAMVTRAQLDVSGVMLAVASGAVASGLGYVAWYAALRGLSGTQAAVVQLSVPVLAAAGGVMLLDETISARLVVSAVVVLGGIALAIATRRS